MADISLIVSWIREHAPEGAKLTLDSRKVRPGDVFFAVIGTRSDGRDFIEKARTLGASCVVAEEGRKTSEEIPTLYVKGLYRKLGPIASAYFNEPSAAMTGFAVTGTNGKTTTSNWIADLLNRTGIEAACIGTLGCTVKGKALPSVCMTTPDPLTLQELFAELRDCRCQAFAMEASSIGLEQGRIDGTAIKTAVFTNLTRDHLDYHKTMEAYLEAKEILFEWPTLLNAVVNVNGNQAERIIKKAQEAGKNILRVGIGSERDADLQAADIRFARSGLHFDVIYRGHTFPVEAKFLGLFNIENFLCALGALVAEGLPLEKLIEEARLLEAPAGRMQVVSEENAPLAVIDYSHTPDAITKAIEALRGPAQARGGKIWIVLGAGGDRDHGKRPLMGKAACAADCVVLTSDNPRSEDPLEILRQVKEGVDKPCRVIEDRAEAIRYAVNTAAHDDIVLIAGKGHEDYQEIKGVKHHFSDLEEARRALRAKKGMNNA